MLPEIKALYPSPAEVTLWSAWGHQAPWWKRLIGRGEPPQRLGRLVIDQQGLRLESMEQEPLALMAWEHPFWLKLTRWEVERGVELSLSLKSRRSQPEDPWIQLRAMWPLAGVEEEIPQKQDISPFVDPQAWQTLWKALEAASMAHGQPWRPWLGKAPEAADFKGLRSQTRAPVCVVCGSAHVLALASQVYRCRRCGYEGGEGLAEHLRALKRRQWRAQPQAVRRQAALEDLRLADTALRNALQYTDIPPKANDQNTEPYNIAQHCLGFSLEALGHLRDATDREPEHQELLDFAESTLAFLQKDLEAMMRSPLRKPLGAVRQRVQEQLSRR